MGTYKTAKAAGHTIITDPYLSATRTDVMLVTAASPIYFGSKLVGVVGVDADVKTINKYIQSLDFRDGAYGFLIDTEGDIEVRMMSDGQNLKIVIIDSGVFFDPTTKEKADTTLSAQERQIGGLGLLLVRELMDTINYEREEGKNILTLIKKYNNENNN